MFLSNDITKQSTKQNGKSLSWEKQKQTKKKQVLSNLTTISQANCN